MAAKKKLTLYIPDDELDAMRAEAERLDRSLAYVVRMAWAIARKRIESQTSAAELWGRPPGRSLR